MTKLNSLKRKLEALRNSRWRVRCMSAFAASAIGVLWLLIVMFLVDFQLQLGVAERLVLMVIAAAVAAWVFARWSLPLLGPKESLVDVALLVERQHQIDSDLVAALQFESGDAMKWGSWQLENAVIDRVVERTKDLNVFAGFPRDQVRRRMSILLVTAAALAGAVLLFPQYASTFFNRLALGDQHYPTRTVMETVVINDQVVLNREADRGSRPRAVRCAQAAPLEVLLLCSGETPEKAEASLRSLSAGVKRPLLLSRITDEERRQRVEDGREQIRSALEQPEQDVTGPWATGLATQLRFDVPQAVELLAVLKEDRDGTLRQLLAATEQQLEQWPRSLSNALYQGRLDRHVEQLEYQLFAGDAWTDASTIDLIPLPQVEPRLTVTPPPYATAWKAPDAEAFSRHLSVLEGSRIELDLEVTNGKPLKEAWILVKSEDAVERYELQAKNQHGLDWSLPTLDTPFAHLTQPLRYELQVTDIDGLHLDAPTVGYIRIQADRAPTATTSVVHRLVVPNATPTVSYRVHDDFGIRRIDLRTVIERDRRTESASEPPPGAESSSDSPSATAVAATEGSAQLTIYDGPEPIPARDLPLNGQYQAKLETLNLLPGDRLILTLVVEDDRGDAAGKVFEAEPLVLEVADASTVEAAILEADERSEEQLSDIIKRQLGIGESP